MVGWFAKKRKRIKPKVNRNPSEPFIWGTFSSCYNYVLIAMFSGPAAGLQLVINLEQYENIVDKSFDAGIKASRTGDDDIKSLKRIIQVNLKCRLHESRRFRRFRRI
jgi:hypothetical protein